MPSPETPWQVPSTLTVSRPGPSTPEPGIQWTEVTPSKALKETCMKQSACGRKDPAESWDASGDWFLAAWILPVVLKMNTSFSLTFLQHTDSPSQLWTVDSIFFFPGSIIHKSNTPTLGTLMISDNNHRIPSSVPLKTQQPSQRIPLQGHQMSPFSRSGLFSDAWTVGK